MKKWLGKIKLILMMVLVTSFLTACSAGSTVETTLTINEDLSGSRVMELVIDQSVFDEYFTGTIESLNAAVTETCPSQLTWAYDESTGSKVYTFTLTFASPSDYKSQVDAILGEESDVEIQISKADSVWANGVAVKESFTSEDILAWLKTMLVEKGFVDSSNSSKIFQLGNNNVSFAGNEYSASNRINIDKIEYLSINSINLLTEVNGFDSYNKVIEISIPESSMTSNGDEIKTWLADRVPTGAESEWLTEGTNSIFKVSKNAMTCGELEQFLNEYFDSDACSVVHKEVNEGMSPFSFNIELVETVDFSNYVIGDRSYYTELNNYVKGANGYVGGSNLHYLAEYEGDEATIDKYEGYRNCNRMTVENGLRQYTSYYQKIYRVSDVSIQSKVGLFGGLSREYVFTLATEPSDDEKEHILEKIEALGYAYAEKMEAAESTELSTEEAAPEESEEKEDLDWNVKITDKVKDGVYTVKITQKGDRAELKASSSALFGSEGDFYRVKDFSFAKLNYAVSVYDSVRLGDFVDYVTDEATATYILNTGFGSKVEYTDREDSAEIKGAKVKLSNSDIIRGCSVVTYGTQFNFWALLFYVLLIGGIVCIVLVLKKEGIIDQLIAMIPKKAATPVAPVQTGEGYTGTEYTGTEYAETTYTGEMVAEDIPMFCTNCGARRDADACVCTQCGTRFED